MQIVVAAVLAASVVLAASAGDRLPALQDSPEPSRSIRVHHVHLVPGDPNQFADYYARLFEAKRVERGEYWGHPGVRDARGALLFSAHETARRAGPSVVWQMGWGAVTLDQSYREHYVREVNWAPPYASLTAQLHLHLRTSDPAAAAAWYRDVLGATVTLSRDATSPLEGITRALVIFDGLALALHVAKEPIVASTDSGSVDHIAFATGDLPSLRRHMGQEASSQQYRLRGKVSAFFTGPDGLRIELVDEPQ